MFGHRFNIFHHFENAKNRERLRNSFTVMPVLILVFCFCSLWACHHARAASKEGENEQLRHERLSREVIQAAMIVKFTDFIKWPAHAFRSEDGQDEWFTIAVFGEGTYQGLFEPFTDRTFQKRKLKVVHFSDPAELDIKAVQILIVPQIEEDVLDTLLETVAERPVLTVGDFPGFARKGGLINFFPKPQNRVGFEINRDAKERSGLKISSHLLRLSKIISNK